MKEHGLLSVLALEQRAAFSLGHPENEGRPAKEEQQKRYSNCYPEPPALVPAILRREVDTVEDQNLHNDQDDQNDDRVTSRMHLSVLYFFHILRSCRICEFLQIFGERLLGVYQEEQ